MKGNFDAALKLVLQSEGGRVDNKADPGGRTNLGCTQRVYSAYLKVNRRLDADVYDISSGDVSNIYRTQYADAVHFNDLPAGLDYAVFDAAVNSGPVEAARWLQDAVGVTTDGHIGLLTLAAVRKIDPVAAIVHVCEERLTFLQGLSTWKTFGVGWANRVASVRKNALAIAAAPEPLVVVAAVIPAPVVVSPGPVVAPAPVTPSPKTFLGWLRSMF